MELIIATRESPLAMWQAEHVQALLQQAHSDLTVSLLPMTTEGDQKLEGPCIRQAERVCLLKSLKKPCWMAAPLAVHSLKDVPVHFPRAWVWSA